MASRRGYVLWAGAEQQELAIFPLLDRVFTSFAGCRDCHRKQGQGSERHACKEQEGDAVSGRVDDKAATELLSASPIAHAAAVAGRARLYRPVPFVRSATTMKNNATNTPAPIPSRIWIATRA
jgi:hypothetical protein